MQRERNFDLILISNEVGLGIVPDNALARAYRDLLGKLNQHVAQEADEVYWMVAGIPIAVKALAESERIKTEPFKAID